MRRFLWIVMLCGTLISAQLVGAQEVSGVAFFRLAVPSGFVMLPDGVTLIVSQAKEAKLIYFDTVADKETKQVEVDFKPGVLAIQGTTLFAAGAGSSIVYVLSAADGKLKREIEVGGSAIAQLACHPKQGMLYATTSNREVFAIDPASGMATKTKAKGDLIAVDPVSGEFVYTGIKPPPEEDELVIETDRRGNIRFIWDRWGVRGAIIKYQVNGKQLSYAESQNNAAVNAYMMHLSADGKRIMMTGGGGWRPPREGGTGGGYFTAVFNCHWAR